MTARSERWAVKATPKRRRARARLPAAIATTTAVPDILYVGYPALTLTAANAVQTFATVRALRAIVPDCTLLVPRFGRRESAWTALGARHLARIPFNAGQHLLRSVGWSYAERTWFAFRALGYLLRRRTTGDAACVLYVRDAVCAAWLALLAPSLTGARVVYESHDLETMNPSANTGPVTRWLAARVDACALTRAAGVVSLTETFVSLLRTRALLRPHTPVAVIPDAYDESRFTPRDRDTARRTLGLPPEAFIVAYTGMTFAYRGLDRLVAAFASFRARHPHARLVLVGGRERERADLRAHAARLGIADAVQCVPPQANAAIPAYLAAADALVLPDTVSKESASPLKLFEYAAMERPIIAADLPALREILPGDAAVYVPAGDTGALDGALEWIAAHPDAARARAVAARAAVAPFTYRARAAAIAGFCRTVASDAA